MRSDHARLLQRVAAVIGPDSGYQAALGGRTCNAPVCRTRLRLTAAQWVAGLPALGEVLYLSGPLECGSRVALSPGVLVESIELGPLLQTRTLAAAGTITPDGPREWVDCLGAADQVLARLYLLPDTDYLAWDALQANASPATEERALAAPAAWRPVSARLLRFRVRRLAGLYLLGAEVGIGTSSLGCELAARIARDEVHSR
ncbi:MAG: hypothetical protein ABI247_09600 [Rhodanobacter sp.]